MSTIPSMRRNWIANVWFDHGLGQLVYNIDDKRYLLLSADAGVNKGTEIDLTQKKAAVSGRSPANILVSTFSDELTLNFARTLIENESLSEEEVTDYLSVSFSSTDYVGHFFGPSSLRSNFMENSRFHDN